jgi:hypothetical protein
LVQKMWREGAATEGVDAASEGSEPDATRTTENETANAAMVRSAADRKLRIDLLTREIVDKVLTTSFR